MSTDEVTVSLSRLALAKAIKTPDNTDQDAEPWTKSVIFHQSHIDEQMRNSIFNSSSNKQRRKPGSRQPPLIQQQQQRYSTLPMNRPRPEQASKSYTLPVQRQSPVSSVGKLSNHSSNNNQVANKSSRRFVPSDDEEEEEDEDEDEDSEDESEDEKTIPVAKVKTEKTIPVAPVRKTEIVEEVPKINQAEKPAITVTNNKGKSKNRVIEPSDDEEEESDIEEEDEEEEEEKDETFDRRMSTLRQLEQPSLHRRTRSTGDVSQPEIIVNQNTDPIEQWRMTVLDAEEPSSSNSSSHHEDDTNDKPIMKAKNKKASANMMEDMYYQQQMYNMQLQQAMQMQQAQQMMYQQALQIQQYRNSIMLDPSRSMKQSQNNRKSVSAMDLMMQMEHEKASTRKNMKKKIPDPSKAKLKTGLLSKVPEHGVHNINFQDYVLKQQMMHSNNNNNNNNNRKSHLMSSPMPTMSMSTPQPYLSPHHHHQQSMMLQQQQQQQMMSPSRSSQFLQNDMSKRQSTYSNLNQF